MKSNVRKKRLKGRKLERRNAQRLNIPIRLKYKIAHGKDSFNKAKCVNISGGGVQVLVGFNLKPEDNVDICFYAGRKHGPFSALCTVVWCKKLKEKRFAVGLRFMNAKDNARFSNYLCDEMVKLFLSQKI